MHAPTHHNSRNTKTPKQLPVETCIERESCKTEKPIYRRKSRAKRCFLWEDYIRSANSTCAERLKAIAKRFPDLTTQQLRIAALVADMLTTATIAKILGVTEHAVEKVRSRIRIKVAVPKGVSLPAFLLAIT